MQQTGPRKTARRRAAAPARAMPITGAAAPRAHPISESPSPFAAADAPLERAAERVADSTTRRVADVYRAAPGERAAADALVLRRGRRRGTRRRRREAGAALRLA
jgi:hypothetical protein